jgi:phosphoesterase RecJ-like protein
MREAFASPFLCPRIEYISLFQTTRDTYPLTTTVDMQSVIEAVLPLFHSRKKFVLTTHINPDGDGLGSELALAEWLASQGKTVHVLNHSDTPEMYLFLDENQRIQKFDIARHTQILAEADVILIMDTNHPDRLRSMQQPVLSSPGIKICIDHHLEPAPFAQYYLIDDDATSTGEITYRLLLQLAGEHLSRFIASALYCAIMTDTGSFRYPRVDPEIHRIVAHLIECGADPITIYSRVYEQWSAGRMRLLGETLSTLSVEYDGKLAHMTVTQEVLDKTDTTEEDTDNFTTYPMSVEGVVIGLLFLELKESVKISFRSKGEIPINELAQQFGGNGHKNAAGTRLHNVTLPTIKDQVIRASSAFLIE